MEWLQTVIVVFAVTLIFSMVYKHIAEREKEMQKKIDALGEWISESNDIRERAVDHLQSEIERLEAEIYRLKLK